MIQTLLKTNVFFCNILSGNEICSPPDRYFFQLVILYKWNNMRLRQTNIPAQKLGNYFSHINSANFDFLPTDHES